MPDARLSSSRRSARGRAFRALRGLAFGGLLTSGLVGCGQDACEEFEAERTACQEYDPANDQGGYTGAACTEEARVLLECLLNEGIDTCKVFYHPEQLSEEDVQKVVACQG